VPQPYQITKIPFSVVTSGLGVNCVEIGIHPTRLTLDSGPVLWLMGVPVTVDIDEVVITFEFRGTVMLIDDHGVANICVEGSVYGWKSDDGSS
jgi:hypothetical protein